LIWTTNDHKSILEEILKIYLSNVAQPEFLKYQEEANCLSRTPFKAETLYEIIKTYVPGSTPELEK